MRRRGDRIRHRTEADASERFGDQGMTTGAGPRPRLDRLPRERSPAPPTVAAFVALRSCRQ